MDGDTSRYHRNEHFLSSRQKRSRSNDVVRSRSSRDRSGRRLRNQNVDQSEVRLAHSEKQRIERDRYHSRDKQSTNSRRRYTSSPKSHDRSGDGIYFNSRHSTSPESRKKRRTSTQPNELPEVEDSSDRRQQMQHVVESDHKKVKGENKSRVLQQEQERVDNPPNQYGQQSPSDATNQKEAANFGLSGALAKDTRTGNVYKGIVLKWSEPPDAGAPTRHWRFYVFKEEEILQVMHIHRQSAYLIGRERKIADIPIDHPSCSKQHAVLQYRLRETEKEGEMETNRSVKPYILDLERLQFH